MASALHNGLVVSCIKGFVSKSDHIFFDQVHPVWKNCHFDENAPDFSRRRFDITHNFMCRRYRTESQMKEILEFKSLEQKFKIIKTFISRGVFHIMEMDTITDIVYSDKEKAVCLLEILINGGEREHVCQMVAMGVDYKSDECIKAAFYSGNIYLLKRMKREGIKLTHDYIRHTVSNYKLCDDIPVFREILEIVPWKSTDIYDNLECYGGNIFEVYILNLIATHCNPTVMAFFSENEYFYDAINDIDMEYVWEGCNSDMFFFLLGRRPMNFSDYNNGMHLAVCDGNKAGIAYLYLHFGVPLDSDAVLNGIEYLEQSGDNYNNDIVDFIEDLKTKAIFVEVDEDEEVEN